MKLRIDVADKSYTLDLTAAGNGLHRYSIVDTEAGDVETAAGTVNALEVMPGVFSVLDGTRSRLITLMEGPDGLEAWIDSRRYVLTVSDPRDQPSGARRGGSAGPLEVRSLMPGKVIRVLVQTGENVSAGQGLVVVEAMKMQNELKAPRDGRIQSVAARAGDTILAGAALVVLDRLVLDEPGVLE